jgi:two-component system CitB family response regulator
VIILSAATDAESVRAAVMRGALNYLVKPFTATQLADRLVAYARYRGRVAGDRALSQDDIDHAFRTLHEGDASPPRNGSRRRRCGWWQRHYRWRTPASGNDPQTST